MLWNSPEMMYDVSATLAVYHEASCLSILVTSTVWFQLLNWSCLRSWTHFDCVPNLLATFYYDFSFSTSLLSHFDQIHSNRQYQLTEYFISRVQVYHFSLSEPEQNNSILANVFLKMANED